MTVTDYDTISEGQLDVLLTVATVLEDNGHEDLADNIDTVITDIMNNDRTVAIDRTALATIADEANDRAADPDADDVEDAIEHAYFVLGADIPVGLERGLGGEV